METSPRRVERRRRGKNEGWMKGGENRAAIRLRTLPGLVGYSNLMCAPVTAPRGFETACAQVLLILNILRSSSTHGCIRVCFEHRKSVLAALLKVAV